MYLWVVESSADGLSHVILAYLKTAMKLRKLYRVFQEEVSKLISRVRYISMCQIRAGCWVMHIQNYAVMKVGGA
jgi:hypothetical protein